MASHLPLLWKRGLGIGHWAFGHTELTVMICLSDRHTIASLLVRNCPMPKATWERGWKQLSSNQVYTAISRKVVGKSARDNADRYCGWFWVYCSSKKFERIAPEAMDICLQVLEERNKGRFDSYSRQEQCIGRIPYCHSGLARAHFFPTTFLEIAVCCHCCGSIFSFV